MRKNPPSLREGERGQKRERQRQEEEEETYPGFMPYFSCASMSRWNPSGIIKLDKVEGGVGVGVRLSNRLVRGIGQPDSFSLRENCLVATPVCLHSLSHLRLAPMHRPAPNAVILCINLTRRKKRGSRDAEKAAAKMMSET